MNKLINVFVINSGHYAFNLVDIILKIKMVYGKCNFKQINLENHFYYIQRFFIYIDLVQNLNVIVIEEIYSKMYSIFLRKHEK